VSPDFLRLFEATAALLDTVSVCAHTRTISNIFVFYFCSSGWERSLTRYRIYIYICIFTYIYIHTSTHTYIYTDIPIYIYTDMYVYDIYKNIYSIHIHNIIYTSIYIYIYIYTYIYMQDPTLMCISSWNDNGYTSNDLNPKTLMRSGFFPGLGWMLRKQLWTSELSAKWPTNPTTGWNLLMRTDEQTKDRG